MNYAKTSFMNPSLDILLLLFDALNADKYKIPSKGSSNKLDIKKAS